MHDLLTVALELLYPCLAMSVNGICGDFYMRRARRLKGFTLLELLVVVGLLAITSAISVPLITGALGRARANGAAEALVGAIRDARIRAISTGWQYRVVAYAPSGAVPNAFRSEGIDAANGGVWPAAGTASSPPTYGSTQMAESYTSLASDFGAAQIQIPGGGASFTVTFDSRGQWAVACVPASCQAQVATPSGVTTLTVAQGGAIQMVKQ